MGWNRMPSLVERKQTETGKWFLVHSSISLPRRAADHGSGPQPRPRISKSSPGTEGLGSEPPDEPVAGTDSTWSFERQAPAACSGTKGILYTITSRGVSMRTLHGVSAGHDTAFRHPGWFAYMRTNLRFRRRSVHRQLVWAPGAPYGLAWYADAKSGRANQRIG